MKVTHHSVGQDTITNKSYVIRRILRSWIDSKVQVDILLDLGFFLYMPNYTDPKGFLYLYGLFEAFIFAAANRI